MQKRIFSLLLAMILVFSLCGCEKLPEKKTKNDEKKDKTETEVQTATYTPSKAELVLDSMTTEEKVAQLIFTLPEALTERVSIKNLSDDEKITVVTDEMRRVYEEYPIGGFILFARNVETPGQLKKLTSDLHALGDIEPLITIDEEGGSVTRIARNSNFNVAKFADNAVIADTSNKKNALDLGTKIGAYLTEYGIDLDFAPVADVNTNPNNPVIGKRAFGSDPEVAAEMVTSVIEGLHKSDNMSCIKHFPGHGDTSTDSHKGYAKTDKTWDEIKNCEMIPFVAGIEAGTDMVMVAHICAPNVTGDQTPASLSYTLITEKLRGELGYDGVVITDALNMGAITDNYTSSEAAVAAIKAGADIILAPLDFRAAYNAILSAVNFGEISVERLDQSVLRILNLKYE